MSKTRDAVGESRLMSIGEYVSQRICQIEYVKDTSG